jgi:hypothetical protein
MDPGDTAIGYDFVLLLFPFLLFNIAHKFRVFSFAIFVGQGENSSLYALKFTGWIIAPYVR